MTTADTIDPQSDLGAGSCIAIAMVIIAILK